jgi:methyl-accepting chemotaxis protein
LPRSAIFQNSLKPLIGKVSDIVGRLGTKTEANLDELFASLIAISKEIEARTPEIADDIDEIADKAKVDLDQVKKFVSDGNAEAVENILANLEQASKDATTVSADVKQVSAKIRSLPTGKRLPRTGAMSEVRSGLEYILRSVAQNMIRSPTTSTARPGT